MIALTTIIMKTSSDTSYNTNILIFFLKIFCEHFLPGAAAANYFANNCSYKLEAANPEARCPELKPTPS